MSHPDRDRPCVVLLLPERLEAFERRTLAESLLAVDGVVVVDPPPISYARQARWPEALGIMVAQRQAKRLRKRLPGTPAALAIFHPSQYRLARSLVAVVPECALLYGPHDEDRPGRLAELHHLASERAELVFGTDDAALRAAVADALAAAEA